MLHLVTYNSGNLAAQTMQLVNALITNVDEWKLRAVTDGGIIADGLTAQGLRVVDVDDAPNWMNGAQLLVTSIRSPGTQERRLIRVARELSIPSVVLLADLGSGSAKFRDNEGWALPDAIGVADAVTWQTLAAQGIPPGILRPVGSPYLDSLAETTPSHHRSALQVCLFDVPNDLDFVTWGIAPLYSEEQVRDAFAAAVRSVTDAHALLRPHPKQIRSPDYRPRLPSEIELEGVRRRLPVEEIIANCDVVVSTYSTVLLLALEFGKPAISLQPSAGEVIRGKLYETLGIPVARFADELAVLLQEDSLTRLRQAIRPVARYNAHRSMGAVKDLIESMLANTIGESR